MKVNKFFILPIFIISVLYCSASPDSGLVLDLRGEVDSNKINVSFLPGNTVSYTPIGNTRVDKVVSGDETIWNRSKKQHFKKLLIFFGPNGKTYMHIFLRHRNVDKILVMIKTIEGWILSGTYKDKFPRKNKKPGEPLQFELEKDIKDLDISEDPDEGIKAKVFISSSFPLTEYHSYAGTPIERVRDGTQTIWEHVPRHKNITSVWHFKKGGYNELLQLGTGTMILEGETLFFEKKSGVWRPIDMSRFLLKFKIAAFNEVDPELDLVPPTPESTPYDTPAPEICSPPSIVFDSSDDKTVFKQGDESNREDSETPMSLDDQGSNIFSGTYEETRPLLEEDLYSATPEHEPGVSNVSNPSSSKDESTSLIQNDSTNLRS